MNREQRRKAAKAKPTATRKPKLINPVTLWMKLQADPDRVIPLVYRAKIVANTNAAYARARTGAASIDDWQTLSDCVSMAETLVLFMRIAQDPTGLLRKAAIALLQVQRRIKAGQTALLDGEGLRAVAEIVASYQDMLDGLTERQMVEAERITAERYKLLLQNKKFTRIFDGETEIQSTTQAA